MVLLVFVIPVMVAISIVNKRATDAARRVAVHEAWVRYDDLQAGCARATITRRNQRVVLEYLAQHAATKEDRDRFLRAYGMAPPIDCHVAYRPPSDPRPKDVLAPLVPQTSKGGK